MTTGRDLQRDLTYLANPALWRRPVVPMKRHTPRGLELAYYVGPAPELRLGNMFLMSQTDRTLTFSTHAAMLEAGWQVD